MLQLHKRNIHEKTSHMLWPKNEHNDSVYRNSQSKQRKQPPVWFDRFLTTAHNNIRRGKGIVNQEKKETLCSESSPVGYAEMRGQISKWKIASRPLSSMLTRTPVNQQMRRERGKLGSDLSSWKVAARTSSCSWRRSTFKKWTHIHVPGCTFLAVPSLAKDEFSSLCVWLISRI